MFPVEASVCRDEVLRACLLWGLLTVRLYKEKASMVSLRDR